MAQLTRPEEEALNALVASFKALNKYDSELNTGEVMNWLDEHYDAEQGNRLDTILAGDIPLKDADGNEFVLWACWTIDPDGAKIGKRMAIYEELKMITLSQADVDGLFDGVDMWVKLRICESES